MWLCLPAVLVTIRFLIIVIQPVPHREVVDLHLVNDPYCVQEATAEAAEDEKKDALYLHTYANTATSHSLD